MTYNAKAVIIEFILVVVSGVGTIILVLFFGSKGLEEFARLSSFIPTTVMGVYFLFGKYVYLNGIVFTKPLKIGVGLFLLFLMPVLRLIIWRRVN